MVFLRVDIIFFFVLVYFLKNLLKTLSEKRINNIILSSGKCTTANDILAYLLNKKTIQSVINQKKNEIFGISRRRVYLSKINFIDHFIKKQKLE